MNFHIFNLFSKKNGNTNINNQSSQIITEADVENQSQEENNQDIYNSEPDFTNKTKKWQFFRLFKFPILILGIIIAIFLVFKILFHNLNKANVQNKNLKPIKPYSNKPIKYKKMFSPSTFNYTDLKSSSANKKNSENFKSKFYKEMKLLKKIKKPEYHKNNQGYTFNNINKTLPPIPKKMVVFVKESYANFIIKKEKDIKNNKKYININNTLSKNKVLKEVVIPTGTVVNAYIKYKIFSYNTEVPAIAVLSNTFYYSNKPFLKKGDKFFGIVGIKHSLNRLNMRFSKIIEKNGKSLNIDAIAMMPNGSGGVKGVAHHHYTGNVLTSLSQGVLGAAALFAGGGSGVNSSNPYTFQNEMRQNVAQNEFNQAQNGLNSFEQSEQNITVTLPKDTPIKIIFLRSVR